MVVQPRDDRFQDDRPQDDRPQGYGTGSAPERDRVRDPVNAADAIAEGVRGMAPAGIPHRLCVVAVELLPVTGASVSLRGNGMPVRMSASDDAAARVAEIQATLGDGPSLHAAETGAPVLASDLTTGRDARRWPVFAQQAAESGVQAVYSLPLGSGAVCVGTFDLYGDIPHELTEPELHTARLVAGVMTLALMSLSHEEGEEGEEGEGGVGEESWLSGLATAQDETYQAIGMIMAQLGIGAEEALARLRASAFAQGRTALDVAHEVITYRKRFDRD
ncbi:GAF and ANTAR domain-containing protein [Streptomyces kebangsaanensis]|uniref:GAF and ANTAR domain-containing protein n=1 Tax=Streptomyces kebangsaanensis TaxID=864058 RepID=UPI00389AFFF6